MKYAFVLMMAVSTAMAAEVDLTTPRGALTAFYQALEAGDAAAVREALLASNDQEKQLADAFAAQLVAARALAETASAKFGNVGDALSRGMPMREQIDQLNKAEIKTEGDTATITFPKRRPLRLTKSDGRWRIAVADYAGATAENIAAQIAVLNDFAKAFNAIASDISSGKLPDPVAAQRALQQKLQAIMFNTLTKNPPTTNPAR